MGCVQELNREAGQLSHGAREKTTGTYQRRAEVCGRAGQSTQKGKEEKNVGCCRLKIRHILLFLLYLQSGTQQYQNLILR